MFSPASTVWPHVEAGRLKALATTEKPRRQPIAPDLPTMAEAGLPGYDTGIWNGLWRPRAHARAVIRQARERRSTTALKADAGAHGVARPERRAARRQPGGIRPPFETDTNNWTTVAKAAGLKK